MFIKRAQGINYYKREIKKNLTINKIHCFSTNLYVKLNVHNFINILLKSNILLKLK